MADPLSTTARNIVLIVEDDADTVSSLSRMLKAEGYGIESASTIRAALERPHWDSYLAVILDRRLPDGMIDDFLPAFRERDPDIAIIIVTGYSDLDGTITALREGVEDYLIKPVKPEMLLSQLKRIAEKRQSSETVLRLEKEVIQASEEERHRIAREIHDGLGSMLGGIRMLCVPLEESLRKANRNQEADKVTEISGLIHEAVKQARALSHGLHAVGTGPTALETALENLARIVSQSGTIACECLHSESVPIEEPVAANHLYRIAQEAVNNAVKHGACTKVTIELSRCNGEIDLRIRDNGSGITETGPGQGLGLQSMDYRARAIGGRLTISARPAGGSEIRCRVSL